jgi:hypothetical protein
MRYQLECPICRSVESLRVRAGPLQAFIQRVLPRSLSRYHSEDELTLRQQGASDWFFAMNNCLRRAMAPHPRCGACTVLMGPGHADAGTEGFCETHRELGMRGLSGTIGP